METTNITIMNDVGCWRTQCTYQVYCVGQNSNNNRVTQLVTEKGIFYMLGKVIL